MIVNVKDLRSVVGSFIDNVNNEELEAKAKELLESYADLDDNAYVVGELSNRYKAFLTYNDLVECCDCGNIVEISDARETYDAYYVCDDCFQISDNWQTCDNCHFAVRYIDTTGVDGCNELWCPDCIDNDAPWCDGCESYTAGDTNEIYTRADRSSSVCWCESCFESGDAYYCNECGEYFTEDCGSYDDEYDEWYCDDCMGSARPEEIRNYSYKPDPQFRKTDAERDIDNYELCFFGVEVETDARERKDRQKGVRDLVEILGDFFYYKEDGSLNYGFECVSHPATIDYWLEHKDTMKRAFESLVNNGFRSHETSTCGYHIHASRRYLGSTTKEQEQVINKILLILEGFRPQIERFSRRKDYHWSHFLSETSIDNGIINRTCDIKNTKVIDLAKNQNTSRYAVLNLNNYHTIELRVLRGTLNIETFIAGLQLFKNIIDLAKTRSEKQLNGLKWGKVINYNKNYSELKAYSKRRNIDNDALLVVTKEPQTFVIGDRVKLKQDAFYSYEPHIAVAEIGSIGKITDMYDKQYVIEYNKKEVARINRHLRSKNERDLDVNSNGRFYMSVKPHCLERIKKESVEEGEL